MAIITAGRFDLGASIAGAGYAIEADAGCVELVPDPLGQRTVCRLTQRSDSADYGGHPRAEIRLPAWAPQAEVWLDWETLLLRRDFYPDQHPHTIVFQIHGTPDVGDAGEGFPPLAFIARGHQMRIKGAYDATASSSAATRTELEFGVLPCTYDEWVKWTVQAKFDWTSAGKLNVWCNDRQVVKYTGPLGYNDAAGCYAKIGTYCSGGVDSRLGARTIYTTGFVIGDAASSYAEVTAGRASLGWGNVARQL